MTQSARLTWLLSTRPRALRPRFPDAVFFTTDLDVRLLQPGDYADTRNLLIASHNGLSLKDALQGSVAPFRSTYDTASYLGTLRAVQYPPMERLPPKELPRVRLYEVGRSGAYELTLYDKDADPFGVPNPRLHPWVTRGATPWVLLGAGVLVAGLLGAVSRPWRRLLWPAVAPFARLWRGKDVGDQVKLTRVHGFAVGVFLVSAALAGVIYWAHVTRGEESFELFEGVSIWPTVILRVLASALCVYYIAVTCEQIGERNANLRRDYFLKPGGAGKPQGNRHFLGEIMAAWGGEWNGTKVCELYDEFERSGDWRWRLVRCGVLFALAWALILLLRPLAPYTQVAARGHVTRAVNFGVLLLSGVTLLALLLFVLDCTLLSYRFVTSLASRLGRLPEPGPGGPWPPELLDGEAAKRGLPLRWEWERKTSWEAVGHLLRIRLINDVTNVVAHLIYYPFVVLLVLIVAQNRLFDDWHWNVPLVLVALGTAGTAVVCAFLLQRTARGAKETALQALDGLLLPRAGVPADEVRDKLTQVRSEIEGATSGAFAGWSQSPIVQAVLIPLAGGGGLAALEAILPYVR
jgi:hypothetical protein